MIGWTNGPCTTKIAIANLIWPESGKWAPDQKSCIDDCLCSEKASDHFYLSLVQLGVHKACQYTENLRPIFLLVFNSWILLKPENHFLGERKALHELSSLWSILIEQIPINSKWWVARHNLQCGAVVMLWHKLARLAKVFRSSTFEACIALDYLST